MRYAAMCLFMFASSAYGLTGNQAVEQVLSDKDGVLYLQFYVKGLIDAETAVRINAKGAARVGRFVRPFCVPAGATTQQAVSIVQNRLRDKPEDNHLDLFLVARRAFLDAWPCTDEQVTGE